MSGFQLQRRRHQMREGDGVGTARLCQLASRNVATTRHHNCSALHIHGRSTLCASSCTTTCLPTRISTAAAAFLLRCCCHGRVLLSLQQLQGQRTAHTGGWVSDGLHRPTAAVLPGWRPPWPMHTAVLHERAQVSEAQFLKADPPSCTTHTTLMLCLSILTYTCTPLARQAQATATASRVACTDRRRG